MLNNARLKEAMRMTAWTVPSPRRADLCKSSAASHAQANAITTHIMYSTQKNLEIPVSTPSHEQVS